MTYRVRHILITLFILSIFGVYFYTRYQASIEYEVKIITDRQIENITDVDRNYSQIIQTAAQDLSILTKLPTIDNFLSAKQKQKGEAEQMFILALKSFVRVRNYYDQLRLLSMQGFELVRVNSSPNGPIVVPHEKLQDKSTHAYFLEARKLKDDQVYISALDLNIEHGKIEIPRNPMLRLSRRVKSSSGNEGILVINIFGQKLLHSFIETAMQLPGQFFIVNELGYYLHNPEEKKEWSHFYEFKYNIAKDYSQETWMQILSGKDKVIPRPEGIWVVREISNPLVDPNYPDYKIRALFLLDKKSLDAIGEPILKDELKKFTVFSIMIILVSLFIYRLLYQRQLLIQKEKEAQDHIQNLSKMASLGTLAAGISHEINNPLAIIRAMGMMIKDKMPTQDVTVEKLFKHQDEAIERVATIVRGLKSLTGPKVDFMQTIPVHLVFDDLCEISKLRAKQSHINIDCQLNDVQAHIVGDRAQLHQVFMGLMTNAFDAISENNQGQIAIEGSIVENYYCVKVRDNGVGISKENLSRIFDPFFSTKPVGKGVGIGLSFAQAYLHAIGGSVEVESTVGQGTVFKIKLPLARGENSES